MDTPWEDLKVAFSFDGDEEALWALCGHSGAKGLPPGWSLNETDSSGARKVAVFRVEGALLLGDARTVKAALNTLV